MEYIVRYSADQTYFESEVNDMLKDGYILAGGVSIHVIDDETVMLAQALVKKTKKQS